MRDYKAAANEVRKLERQFKSVMVIANMLGDLVAVEDALVSTNKELEKQRPVLIELNTRIEAGRAAAERSEASHADRLRGYAVELEKVKAVAVSVEAEAKKEAAELVANAKKTVEQEIAAARKEVLQLKREAEEAALLRDKVQAEVETFRSELADIKKRIG